MQPQNRAKSKTNQATKNKKKESKRKLHILSAEQNKRMTKPVSECKNWFLRSGYSGYCLYTTV